MFKVQGMGTHLREAHQIIYNGQQKSPASEVSGRSVTAEKVTASADNLKFPDSGYTPMDLFILKGRLFEASVREAGPKAKLRKLSYVDKVQLVKRDFEKFFHVAWPELVRAHPDVFSPGPDGGVDVSAYADCRPYAGKKYSTETGLD